VYQQQQQQQQEQQQDAENPFLDPPFSRIKTVEMGNADAGIAKKELKCGLVSVMSARSSGFLLSQSLFQGITRPMVNYMKPFGGLDQGLVMQEHLCFCYCKFYPTLQCNCSACDGPPDACLFLRTN
jgi:hypothetical protein